MTAGADQRLMINETSRIVIGIWISIDGGDYPRFQGVRTSRVVEEVERGVVIGGFWRRRGEEAGKRGVGVLHVDPAAGAERKRRRWVGELVVAAAPNGGERGGGGLVVDLRRERPVLWNWRRR